MSHDENIILLSAKPEQGLKPVLILDLISGDVIVFGEVIGEGAFGSVHRAIYNGRTCAVKQLRQRNVCKKNAIFLNVLSMRMLYTI